MTTQLQQDYAQILEAFIASDDFLPAITDSTTAGFGGSGYSVELFPDGTWRVLGNNQIGNRYQSAGLILPLPAWKDEDWAEWEAAGQEPEDYDDERAQILRAYLAERAAGLR